MLNVCNLCSRNLTAKERKSLCIDYELDGNGNTVCNHPPEDRVHVKVC